MLSKRINIGLIISLFIINVLCWSGSIGYNDNNNEDENDNDSCYNIYDDLNIYENNEKLPFNYLETDNSDDSYIYKIIKENIDLINNEELIKKLEKEIKDIKNNENVCGNKNKNYEEFIEKLKNELENIKLYGKFDKTLTYIYTKTLKNIFTDTFTNIFTTTNTLINYISDIKTVTNTIKNEETEFSTITNIVTSKYPITETLTNILTNTFTKTETKIKPIENIITDTLTFTLTNTIIDKTISTITNTLTQTITSGTNLPKPLVNLNNGKCLKSNSYISNSTLDIVFDNYSGRDKINPERCYYFCITSDNYNYVNNKQWYIGLTDRAGGNTGGNNYPYGCVCSIQLPKQGESSDCKNGYGNGGGNPRTTWFYDIIDN